MVSNRDHTLPSAPYGSAPNLCAAAQKCAARAVEISRGRMSEIRSFKCLQLDHMRYLGYTDIEMATYNFVPTEMI